MSATTDTIPTLPVSGTLADERDFEVTFRPLMPELFNYLRRRAQSAEDAADCLSETLEVLWRKRSRLPDDSEGRRKWAFGVAHKVAQAHQRRSHRRSVLDDVLRDQFIDTSPAADDGIHDLLNVLNDRDRELVELVVLDGFPIVEAASILGLRAGAARMRYSRARAHLRSAIEDAP